MSVVLSNAYSAKNAGDRLLVELSTQLLAEAGHSPSNLVVVAVDPASFELPIPVVPAPAAHSLTAARRAVEAGEAITSGGLGRLRGFFESASLRVGVGGGYLRFGRPVEAAKTTVVHLPQIKMAAEPGAPSVLLPQSIGPFARHGREVLDVLRGFHTIYVRDDRSAEELSALDNVHRVPDLAVLAVGSRPRPTRSSGSTGRIGVVLRELGRFPEYEARARSLLRMLGRRALPLLQSDVGSGNRDSDFYRRLGLSGAPWLETALGQGRVDAVVSVRLHGAVQAVLSGVPAVHLSYERKGFAAFSDLGVGEYVHSARSFDPRLVADQARLLAQSPEGYWDQVDSRRPGLAAHREAVVSRIRELAPCR